MGRSSGRLALLDTVRHDDTSHEHEKHDVRRSMRLSTLDGIFGTQYGTMTGGPLLTAFLLALGATNFLIGLVASIPLLGGLLQPIGAEMIRRRGGWRKPIWLSAALADVGLWGISLAAAIWLPAHTAAVVVVGVLALQQIAMAFIGISWTSWASDLIPRRIRGRYFGYRNFVTSIFGAVSAALIGQLVKLAGDGALHVFVMVIAAGMLFRFVSIYVMTRQPEPAPARSTTSNFFGQLSEPLKHHDFRRFTAFAIAWGFANNFAAPFITVYMLRDANVGVDGVMLFSAIGIVANLFGQRYWGRLSDQFGHRQVMQWSALIVVLQPFGWLFTAPTGLGYYLMPLLSFTGGFFWSGYALASGNLMMGLAPETGKTSYFAVQASLNGIFGAISPLIGGLLASTLAGGAGLTTSWLFEGLKTIFFVSFLLRFAAWLLVLRIPEPVAKPKLRATYLIRDAARTLNPAQSFNPLRNTVLSAVGRKR